MAYTDSGLGWYANSDWMTDEAGSIGTLETGGSTPGGATWDQIFPLGSIDPGVTCTINGATLTEENTTTSDNWWAYFNRSPATDIEADITFEAAIGSVLWNFVSQTAPYEVSNGVGCTASGRTATATATSGSFHIRVYGQVNRNDWFTRAKPLTSNKLTLSNVYVNGVRVPMAGEPQTVTIPFAKSSAGYSVTCMCKWNAEIDGDVYCSPVLISTDPNYTLYTRNSALPSVGTTEHTFQGVTFYMRKAPLDIVDGTETITANFPVLDLVEEETYSSDADIFLFVALAAELGVGPVPEDDPYSGAGESGPDAGDPTFDFTSEDIPVPGLPSIGAYNAGFLTLYKPTAGELGTLASYMWSGSFDPDNFRKLFANPMDAILGLHIVPATASHPTSTGASLRVGNIDTQVSMSRLTEQYYELDCGTINVEPKWGAYLDYAPYSKLTLYLPYIGFVPISPDDCMDGSINVKYHVDVLSGACCVYVYCTSNHGTDTHVLYTYTGACACDCPVTEGQYTNAVLGILNIAGSVAGAISGALTGNAGGVTGGIESAANAALSMVKPDISRSGSFGGSAGLMGIQYPYLVLTVPRMCTPGDQQKQEGYPSFVTKAMGQLAGYNQVQVKRLEGMTCTANETEEILTLLEEGVIF